MFSGGHVDTDYCDVFQEDTYNGLLWCFQEDTYNGDDMNDMTGDYASRTMTNPDGSVNYSNTPSLTYGASPNYHPSYDGYASKYRPTTAQLPPELRRICQ